MQIPPSAALSDLVRHYLIIEHASLTGTCRFFPDGSPGLVFSFDDRLTGPALPGPSFVYGQATGYSDLHAGGRLGLLVVVFQPWGLYGLTGIPGTETAEWRVSPGDLFGKQDLEDRLRESASWGDRIRLLEAFLTGRRGHRTIEWQSMQHVTGRMYRTDETLSIPRLAEEVCLTERTLERRFHRMIGLSPKTFSRILRLQNSLKMKRLNPDMSLTEIAYRSGYYDQAHFIREFADLAGLTPGHYFSHPLRLAANLLPV